MAEYRLYSGATITMSTPAGLRPGDRLDIAGTTDGDSKNEIIVHASDAPWWRNAAAWLRWTVIDWVLRRIDRWLS